MDCLSFEHLVFSVLVKGLIMKISQEGQERICNYGFYLCCLYLLVWAILSALEFIK